MKISQLASISEVSTKTIRYYESIGLLKPPVREGNGYRDYKKEDIETLIFVRRCRELNITIEDIKRLVEVQQDPEASCAIVDKIIVQQLERVQQTQRELAKLEVTLKELATSCNNHQVEDCCILHTLKSS